MWEGYFKLGDTEIVNNALTRAMAETADAPVWWFKGKRFASVQPAVAPDQLYDQTYVQKTPWYDGNQPDVSSRFFGAYCLGVSGLEDSTATAEVTEVIGDGGIIGQSRHAAKQGKFTAILVARGNDALEYGMQWLDAVLDASSCGNHGPMCGLTDLTFFADVPAPQDDLSNDDWQELLTSQKRYLHDVARTGGPIISERYESRGVMAFVVDWTITAQRPWVYSVTHDIDLPPSLPITVSDIPYNLMPWPSMELTPDANGSPSGLLATNFAQNPSAEVNSTNWSGLLLSLTGTNVSTYFTSGRSTDVAASGTGSFRGRVLGNGSTAAAGNANIYLRQDVTVGLLATSPNSRYSLTMWLAAFISAGGSVSKINSMKLTATYLKSDGTPTDGLTYTIGSTTAAADFNGKVFSRSLILPPANTSIVRVEAVFNVDWTSSATAANNSDIRMYADALAVTVP